MPPKKSQKQRKRRKATPKTNILQGVGSYKRPSVGPRRLRGRGGYAEDIGSSIGSWLGKKAGSLFQSITGLGDYKVNKNSLMNRPSDPPIVSNTTSATRIQHREYIQDISGSTAFQIQTFPVNPGMSGTFPWLSAVAGAFEEYRLHGILFEYKSTSADALNSVNTALGTVIMATEYNPLHAPFASKREMENYVYSTSCAPSLSALHPLECARDVSVLDELFIRNVPLAGADLRFSDVGNFMIATVGMQASAVIGELWVTYDVELIKPKLPDAYIAVGPAHYAYTSSPAVGMPTVPSPLAGTPTTPNMFGPRGSYLGLLGTGISPITLDTNTITFLATGRFLVILQYNGGSAAVPTWSSTLGASVGSSGLLRANNTGYFQSPQPGVSSTNQTVIFAYNVNDLLAPTVTFSGYVPGSPSFDLFVIPLPAGFTLDRRSKVDILQDMILTLSNKIDRQDSSDEKSGHVIVEEEIMGSPVLTTSRRVATRHTRFVADA